MTELKLMTDSDEKIKEYIDYMIEHSTAEMPYWNKEKILSGTPSKWNYIDGCMITAILELYEITKDKKYADFADAFVGWFINDDGEIKTYSPEEKNLDHLGAARNLFRLYDITGNEKYRKAMDVFRHQLDIQPRTREGSFWHKDIYPNQVWLDGLYMAEPFYMTYETRYNRMRFCSDSFKQFEIVRNRMKNPANGLYYHGYDESRQMYWADSNTGCSKCTWLRSMGWMMCALVETAAAMDESLYYEYRTLGSMLKDAADAIAEWQDESGLFYQVVDHPEAEGNYLETSGTALIAYALLKGVRLDLLPARFAPVAEKAFNGIVKNKLKFKEDGVISLSGICLVAGLGGKTRRDGSMEYYFSEPVVEDDAKGSAPFILAYTEILRRKKKVWNSKL